jgi:predicted O-methyltransferase YrrM
MSKQTIQVDNALYDYILRVSLREAPVLEELRAETAGLDKSAMQISPEQGQFMGLLLKLTNARRYLEVGTFTGYSALVCALAMPADAELFALDISKEWTAIAKRYWEKAGVADRITLHLGSAAETMADMLATQQGSFDTIFIDADKTAYAAYIQYGYELLRPGGFLLIDNVLWSGSVTDPTIDDEDTVAIRRVNEALLSDERFDISLVPIGDGLTIAMKRG